MLSQDTALQSSPQSRCAASLPLMRLSRSAMTSGTDRQYRLAQHLQTRLEAEAGTVGRRHAADLPLRRALGDAAGDVGVEIGGGEQELRRGRAGEVRDGGGRD